MSMLRNRLSLCVFRECLTRDPLLNSGSRLQRGFGGKLNRIKKYFPKTQKDKELEEASKVPVVVPQHPKGLDDTNKQILATERTHYLTNPLGVDARFYNMPVTEFKQQVKMPQMTRYIKVAVIGLPNAGKSTLVNKIVGTQVSAVSKLSYTTWENTIGVKSDLNTGVQIELVDTPGVVDRYDKSKVQVTEAWKAVEESDLILFVVDGARRIENSTIESLKLLKTKIANSGYQEQKLARRIKPEDLGTPINNTSLNSRQSLVLAINKVDICQSKRKIIELKDELEDIVHFDKIFIISGETGFGLEGLVDYISQQAEDGDWEHAPDIKTEQSEAHVVEEFIRESLFNRFYYDIPFNVNINLTRMAIRSDGLMRVNVHLKVLNKNIVPMLIGKNGMNLNWLIEDVESKISQRYKIRSKVTFAVSKSKYGLRKSLFNETDRVDDPESALREEQKELEQKRLLSIDKQDQLATLQKNSKGMDEIEHLKQLMAKSLGNNEDAQSQEEMESNKQASPGRRREKSVPKLVFKQKSAQSNDM